LREFRELFDDGSQWLTGGDAYTRSPVVENASGENDSETESESESDILKFRARLMRNAEKEKGSGDDSPRLAREAMSSDDTQASFYPASLPLVAKQFQAIFEESDNFE
jgi:hypothetical protein